MPWWWYLLGFCIGVGLLWASAYAFLALWSAGEAWKPPKEKE